MQYKVQMTPRLRVISLVLLIVSNLLFQWFGIEFVHFVAYPFLSYPSLADPPTGTPSNHLHNALLLSLFFLQHYLMADLTYKKKMCQLFPLFPAF